MGTRAEGAPGRFLRVECAAFHPVANLRGVDPIILDHVAFWVAERDEITDFATRHLGMHVIDRQDKFTLIGSDARRGKLTLFDAEAPRDRGAFKHVALRVNSLNGADRYELPGGIEVRLVEAPTGVDFDLDHVALFTADPEVTVEAYLDYGFTPAAPENGAPRVEVGGAYVEFHEGDPGDPERPLLNHLAVLVDSAEDHKRDAEDVGIEVESVVDAANTYAVFLWGPDRVRIEYVEHKPSFSLT
jgi:catechol 2,3-dioxygenase-like lactoylglutathione lyase family enzyme